VARDRTGAGHRVRLRARRVGSRFDNGSETMGNLGDAADRGDMDEFRLIPESGVPRDDVDDGDETAVHGAAASGPTSFSSSSGTAIP